MAHTPTTASRHLPVDELEAVIWDYNGVIGLQPTPDMWARLAALAGWPAAQLEIFMRAFWGRRAAYDAGELSDRAFWQDLVRGTREAGPGSELLAALPRADTRMWTRTDPAVLKVLHRAHAAGVPMTLLSNAPLPLASALDGIEWCATLMSRTVYSARIGVNKPETRAFQAGLAAAGWPTPGRTLFVDDRADNVEAAARLGMRTLHYRGDTTELASRLPQATVVRTAACPV
ncbi:HAD family phosphatase [Streptomyces phaeofaciens JCM 4814]|uniref:Hydrolase n=1 Tax=Streptomyces phaeofaciens TaxID=68254 RepID=A0A918HQV6_9ACTN|nr:HAD family phosphatase [Streptomyces phaeofaciens]GGT97423.1 hydrolase [Streptomyces phaeofaciens]